MNTGDKVVCVDDSPFSKNMGLHRSEFDLPGGFIVKGSIYCVSGATTTLWGDALIIVGKPVIWMGNVGGWHPDRFRRLSEMKAENTAKQLQEATA